MSIASELERTLRPVIATKFARAVRIVDDRLDETVPVRLGRLKRSRRTTFRGTGGTLMSATIEYPLDYGQYLDEGVRPHVIVPRRAKVLRFRGARGIVFARRVNHPGTQKHRGWFSRPTSATGWRAALAQVFR